MGKRIIKLIKYVFECFFHIIYEYDELCVVCGEDLFNNEKGLCSKCLIKIKFSENPIYIKKNNISIKCYSISYYSKVITDMIIKLKYKSRFNNICTNGR